MAAVSATDDVGRVVRLDAPARRVLSLLPAGTEIVVALGAGDALVGRTRYDVDPALGHLPSVGGGLDPSLEAIVGLRPDLVIAFETASESRVRPRIEALGIPVFAIRTEDTTDIFRNIGSLGTLAGRSAAADSLLGAIRSDLSAVAASVPGGRRPSVVYVASIDPPIVAGPGTYIGEMIGIAGGRLLRVGDAAGAYWPQVSLEALVRAQPDVVVLPVGSDPGSTVARLRAEPGWRELEAVRDDRVVVVPTDLMSRPGPHIARIAEALRDGFRRVWRGG
ncbi:MAG TPA: helical backbone metal receptor [Longimicrobiaceae bacterium]